MRPFDRLDTGSREARSRGGGPREDLPRTVLGGLAVGRAGGPGLAYGASRSRVVRSLLLGVVQRTRFFDLTFGGEIYMLCALYNRAVVTVCFQTIAYRSDHTMVAAVSKRLVSRDHHRKIV